MKNTVLTMIALNKLSFLFSRHYYLIITTALHGIKLITL